MSLKIYENHAIRDKIEASKSFCGTTPMEVAIEPEMAEETLSSIGTRLTRQLASQGVVGVKLIEVRFAPILDPEGQAWKNR